MVLFQPAKQGRADLFGRFGGRHMPAILEDHEFGAGDRGGDLLMAFEHGQPVVTAHPDQRRAAYSGQQRAHVRTVEQGGAFRFIADEAATRAHRRQPLNEHRVVARGRPEAARKPFVDESFDPLRFAKSKHRLSPVGLRRSRLLRYGIEQGESRDALRRDQRHFQRDSRAHRMTGERHDRRRAIEDVQGHVADAARCAIIRQDQGIECAKGAFLRLPQSRVTKRTGQQHGRRRCFPIAFFVHTNYSFI